MNPFPPFPSLPPLPSHDPPFLPCLSPPLCHLSYHFPSLSFPFPSLSLEVGPLGTVLGSAVSSPSGVWGGSPAEIEFGELKLKIRHIVALTLD